MDYNNIIIFKSDILNDLNIGKRDNHDCYLVLIIKNFSFGTV